MRHITAVICTLMLSPGMALAAGQTAPEIGVKSFGVTFVFILVLGLVAWALKTYGPSARIRKSSGLDIVGQMPLNPKSSLALVRAGKNLLLLGVTQNQVNLIKDLGEDHFEKALSAQSSEHQVKP